MNRGVAVATAIVFGAAASAAGPARAEQPAKLSGYNADIGESSISGISSGAFMAVQFATAWASVIKGVGVVARGAPLWAEGGGGRLHQRHTPTHVKPTRALLKRRT